jgi:hypothetical protein
MQWKSCSAAPRPSPAVAHSRAVAGKLYCQIALAHALLLSRPPAFVGQCCSPCGGGAGQGRGRYLGGPWGAVKGACPSAGWRPASLGRRVAAPGALRYALLGPGGLLAGSLVAPLGLGLTLW